MRFGQKNDNRWMERKSKLLAHGWQVKREPFGWVGPDAAGYHRPSGKSRDVLWKKVKQKGGGEVYVETRRPFLTYEVQDEYGRVVAEYDLP